MKYKREKINNELERRMAIGGIVSTRVLKDLKLIYNPDLIEVPYVRTVLDWCFKYFDKYGKAPKKHIQDIFRQKVKKGNIQEDQSSLIEDFLGEISREYEEERKFNSKYLLDQIEERFSSKNLEHLADDIKGSLSTGDIVEAEALLSRYKRVARPSSTGVNPWTDNEALIEAFEEENTPLFTFPGTFGKMINDQLVREGLIGIMGRAKIGKTWQLMEFAYRAGKARNNVAFFQAGDVTQNKMIIRLAVRNCERSNIPRYCEEMEIPVLDCIKNQEDTCKSSRRITKQGLDGAKTLQDAPTGYQPCSECLRHRPHKYQGTTWWSKQEAVDPITWREALKAGEHLMHRMKGRGFKLASYPNNTLTVEGIKAQLDIWEHFEGFVPDVIIIDYADIMSPEPGLERKETRDQQNGTWKALRRLSQERRCLVITATQADAGSYTAKSLGLTNFSEDRRKYDHVTGMMALNQTPEEKARGEMRVSWLLLREGEFDTNAEVLVLQCLQKGMAHIGSYEYRFKKQKEESED